LIDKSAGIAKILITCCPGSLTKLYDGKYFELIEQEEVTSSQQCLEYVY
jgi:hypothetical protein